MGSTRTDRSPAKPSPSDAAEYDGEAIVTLHLPEAAGQTFKLLAVTNATLIDALLQRGWTRADA